MQQPDSKCLGLCHRKRVRKITRKNTQIMHRLGFSTSRLIQPGYQSRGARNEPASGVLNTHTGLIMAVALDIAPHVACFNRYTHRQPIKTHSSGSVSNCLLFPFVPATRQPQRCHGLRHFARTTIGTLGSLRASFDPHGQIRQKSFRLPINTVIEIFYARRLIKLGRTH